VTASDARLFEARVTFEPSWLPVDMLSRAIYRCR